MIVILCAGQVALASDASLVDLASFGKTRSWTDTAPDRFAIGVEWDEPRDFSLVEVELNPVGNPSPSDLWLEYWVSSWTSAARAVGLRQILPGKEVGRECQPRCRWNQAG
jgi:hypothetical protein